MSRGVARQRQQDHRRRRVIRAWRWAIWIIVCSCMWVPVPASAQSRAAIAVGDARIGAGQTGAVVVHVRDVRDLYGADVQLSFDPKVLQAEDANPAKPGVQVQLGRLLSADLVVRNLADNAAGTVHVAFTQLSPAAPASGSGDLFSVTFRALVSSGTTDVGVSASMLSSRDGIEIPAGTSAGRVTLVSAAQAPSTPTPVPMREPTLVLPPTAIGPTPRSSNETSARATQPRASERPAAAAVPSTGAGAKSSSGPTAGAGVVGGAAGAPAVDAPPFTDRIEPTRGVLPGGAADALPAASTPYGSMPSDGVEDNASPDDGATPERAISAPRASPDAPDASVADRRAAESPAEATRPAQRPPWPWLALAAVLTFAAVVAMTRRS